MPSCAIFPSRRNWGFQCQIRSCEVEVIKWLSRAHTSPRRLVEGEPTVKYDPITSLLVNPLHCRSHHQNDPALVQLAMKNKEKSSISPTGMSNLVHPFARHVVLAVAVPRAPCHRPPVLPRRCDPRTETWRRLVTELSVPWWDPHGGTPPGSTDCDGLID